MDIANTIKNNIGLIGAQLVNLNLTQDDDAYSVGLTALYRAAETYDETRKIKFSTYATTCIYNALVGHIKKINSPMQKSTVSYDAPLPGSDGLTYADVLESPCETHQTSISESSVSVINESIQHILKNTTNTKAKLILETWIDSQYTLTQQEIAQYLGCSQAYVSKVVLEFRRRLRMRLLRLHILEV